MKRFLLFILAVSSFANVFSQEWKQLLRQPGVKYKDVMEKFYEERREEVLEQQKQALKNKDEEGEDDDEFRLEWAALMMLGDRLNPDGTIPNFNARNFEALLQLNSPGNKVLSPAGQWESLGPNHLNDAGFNVKGIGRVNCAFRNSVNEYAGSGGGGLWFRAIGNTNWLCLTNSMPVLSIAGMTTNANGSTIYILTGDGEGTGYSHPGVGILRSTDYGNSWQTTSFNFTAGIPPVNGFKLLADPGDLNTQYAATDSGLYKTTDGWASNSRILAPTGSSITDVELKPGLSTTIYACDRFKVYKSINGGSSWGETATISTVDNGDRLALAVTPANSNYLYVLWGKKNGGFQKLFRTPTGFLANLFVQSEKGVNGVTNILGWEVNAPSNDPDYMKSQAPYDLCIAVNPADASEVWIGGINVWKSADGGFSWNCQSYWNNTSNQFIAKMHADQHNLEFFAGTLYCTNDGGFFIKSGNGWTENFEYLNITQFYKLGLDRTSNNNRHIAGAQDNGEMVYSGNDNFEQLVATGDAGESVVDFTDNGQKLFSSNEAIKTAGNSLGKIPFTDGSGIPGYDLTIYNPGKAYAWMGYRALVMDPANHNRIISGYYGLYRSEDHNNTWIGDELGMSSDATFGMVRHYAFTWNYNDWASKDAKLYRRVDLGGRWIDATGGAGFPSLANRTITGLDVNYFNNNQVWFTLSGYDPANKVFSSGTNGASWNNNTYNLPKVTVNCILRDGNTGNVYIGTDIGVYVLPWATNTWIPFRNGMPSVIVTDLEINPTDGKIYASTYGRGLWRSDVYGGCPANIVLLSLYFPFNGEDPTGYHLYQVSAVNQ